MKQKKQLVIFGLADEAQIAAFYFEHDAAYEVAAFTVDREYLTTETFCGRPVCAFEEVAQAYPPEAYEMFVAIGYSELNRVRAEKCAAAKAKGYHLARYVSSRATCWIPRNDIGENGLILEDNTIQPFVRIGDDVTLWSGNHIGHHAVIEDHVFITSHVVLAGRTRVGHHSFVGVNATVNDHVTIAPYCVIGSGSLIARNTKEQEVYVSERTKRFVLKSDEIGYFK